ncbi:hypothetical protein JO379_002745 [Streptomyces syringium]|uniref:Uncharacterized protein n=1 Tax=Streptomyces syringium TaxID=76729 RepID=A0ABS4Y3C0_9ACTN|nr:hypothetical protein [Streptomyces syringium]
MHRVRQVERGGSRRGLRWACRGRHGGRPAGVGEADHLIRCAVEARPPRCLVHPIEEPRLRQPGGSVGVRPPTARPDGPYGPGELAVQTPPHLQGTPRPANGRSRPSHYRQLPSREAPGPGGVGSRTDESGRPRPARCSGHSHSGSRMMPGGRSPPSADGSGARLVGCSTRRAPSMPHAAMRNDSRSRAALLTCPAWSALLRAALMPLHTKQGGCFGSGARPMRSLAVPTGNPRRRRSWREDRMTAGGG